MALHRKANMVTGVSSLLSTTAALRHLTIQLTGSHGGHMHHKVHRLKPDTSTAMNNLISQVRQAIDFEVSIAKLCNGPCKGCSKKLMEFLDTELEEWECKLSRGELPTLGDINTLAKKSKKIYAALKKNGIID